MICLQETVVTFANPKEEASDDDCSKQGDLYDNILHDVNGDYAAQCADPLDFAALAVLVSGSVKVTIYPVKRVAQSYKNHILRVLLANYQTPARRESSFRNYFRCQSASFSYL